jgi:hypothetical protein
MAWIENWVNGHLPQTSFGKLPYSVSKNGEPLHGLIWQAQQSGLWNKVCLFQLINKKCTGNRLLFFSLITHHYIHFNSNFDGWLIDRICVIQARHLLNPRDLKLKILCCTGISGKLHHCKTTSYLSPSSQHLSKILIYICLFVFIPPRNEVGGGGILDSACPSVLRLCSILD